MPDRPQRILLVGAYERDNFGDLLFLLQTEQYLPSELDVVAAAPFAADMTPLLDRHVPAYGPLLESKQFDHIWTVGGEVGGADLRHAFRMVASEPELERWRSGDEGERAALIRKHVGETPIDSPYMPRPAAYPMNSGSSLTLNSVGFAGVGNLAPERQQMVLDISRQADRISVRDKRSSAWLAKHKIQHTVAPDLVHTIARTRPYNGKREESVALVQVSKPEIRRRGLHAYAEAIARSRNLAPFTIRLFLAGTAPGHDSVEVYRRLIEEIRKIAPGRDIEISQNRRPYDLVDEIASVGLWVGLSLHGRIISSAYGVPRVSLTKRKVDAYASTWDPDMPWGVTPDDLDDAIAEAIAPRSRLAVDDVGGDLAAQAERNILDAVAQLRVENEGARLRRRLDAVESWRRWLKEQNDADRETIRELEGDLARAPREGRAYMEAMPYRDQLRVVGRRGVAGVAWRLRAIRRGR